ncbi:MAG: 4-diphosphocytidyl-2C-methyl-D-erythritol kinase [Rhodospirillales bacterium]|jgi:molybdenum cofactor cytidylyltransferase|nr:4-diphosphocytidyl-2C-methyl-D-erythritol kinase [Rhodospirillales bacterium]
MPAIAAIILAAGASRRAGTTKLVAPIDGVPMVARVVQTAIESKAEPVIVVVGHDSLRVSETYAHFEVITVLSSQWSEGMSRSLAAGLGEVPPDHDGTLVLLADMPYVRVSTLDALIDAFDPTRYQAVQPVYRGKPGNPVLLGRALFAQAATQDGDQGARALLAGLGDRLLRIEVEDPGVLRDIDTAEDLANA